MKTNRSLLLLPVLLIAVAAGCGGDEQAETRSSDASRPSSSAAGGSDRMLAQVEADLMEIDDYRLSMDAVEKYHEAQRSVYRRVQADPSLAEQFEIESDFSSIDDFEYELSSTPLYQDAIDEAGLEPREFVLIAFALFQAQAASQAMDEGVSRESILEQSNMHPDNIEFARQNRARLQQLEEETSALEPDGY